MRFSNQGGDVSQHKVVFLHAKGVFLNAKGVFLNAKRFSQRRGFF